MASHLELVRGRGILPTGGAQSRCCSSAKKFYNIRGVRSKAGAVLNGTIYTRRRGRRIPKSYNRILRAPRSADDSVGPGDGVFRRGQRDWSPVSAESQRSNADRRFRAHEPHERGSNAQRTPDDPLRTVTMATRENSDAPWPKFATPQEVRKFLLGRRRSERETKGGIKRQAIRRYLAKIRHRDSGKVDAGRAYVDLLNSTKSVGIRRKSPRSAGQAQRCSFLCRRREGSAGAATGSRPVKNADRPGRWAEVVWIHSWRQLAAMPLFVERANENFPIS